MPSSLDTFSLVLTHKEARDILDALGELHDDLRNMDRWLDDEYPALEGLRVDLVDELGD